MVVVGEAEGAREILSFLIVKEDCIFENKVQSLMRKQNQGVGER